MERVFVDTSAWVASINRKDPDHRAVRRTLERFDGRLVTSSYVFDETVTVCTVRFSHSVACRVGESLLGGGAADLLRLTPDDEARAWELFVQRSDKTYSFTDCTSFALMRRLGLGSAVALDADFKREGFEVLPT